MFFTLAASNISVVFTAQTVAVEQLWVCALLHVFGEVAADAGVALVGTVVVELALSRMREHGRLVQLTSLLHCQLLGGGGAGGWR